MRPERKIESDREIEKKRETERERERKRVYLQQDKCSMDDCHKEKGNQNALTKFICLHK